MDKYERGKDNEKKDRRKRDYEKKSYKFVDDSKENFMFVYEDDEGILYTDLKHVPLESKNVVIFPVYMKHGNENLIPEKIYYDEKWKTTLKDDNSWLNIINNKDNTININKYKGEEIIVYNDKFFHRQKDLLKYIEKYGAEVLPISK